MNPYWRKDFFGFFATLLNRLYEGSICSNRACGLASDELQLLILIGASITLGIVGSLVVVNRMSMMANSLSHTVLLGIVLVYVMLFNNVDNIGRLGIFPIFLAALISGFITVSFSFLLKKVAGLQEDASIGLVFTSLFAIGIILVTALTRNAHLGIESVMGDIEAVNIEDVKTLFLIATLSIAFVTLFYHKLLAMSFDTAFARFAGLHPAMLLYALMLLCAVSVIACFKSVGVVLVLSLLTAPALIARLFVKKFSSMIVLSCAIGVLASLIAVALSRHILSVYEQPISTSGLLVTLLMVAYYCLLFCQHGVRMWKRYPPLSS